MCIASAKFSGIIKISAEDFYSQFNYFNQEKMVSIASLVINNIPIVAIALASIILALIIIIIERRLSLKMKENTEKKKRDEKLFMHINALKKIKSEKKEAKLRLNGLNAAAKNFFHDFFNISLNSGYSEIIQKLDRAKKYEYVPFCRSMLQEYYSEKEVTDERVTHLAEKLIEIIASSEKLRINKTGREKKRIVKPKKEEFNNFIKRKIEAEKIAKSIYGNKKLMQISKIAGSESQIMDMLAKNREAYARLKEFEDSLKKARHFLNALIEKNYSHINPSQKAGIKSIAESWNKEREKIFAEVKNPVRQLLIDLNLMDKYFRNLMKIIKIQ